MKGKLSLLSMALVMLSSHASSYAPVFTGRWYTDAQFANQDACYQNDYQYRHLTKGTDSTYASSVLSDLSPHQDCRWGNAFLKAKTSTRPLDFSGSNQQWQELRTQKNAATAENWQRDCMQGNAIIDSAITTIWPSYACPTDTHYGQDAGHFTCTNAPLVCNADIVGRDLAPSEMNKILGHVGLVSTLSGNNTVLEVLPNPPAVYENTLESFIRTSQFWGEKYGLKKTPKLSAAQANKIIRTSANQKQYSLEYTIDWHYSPGTPTQKVAIFRCDSFVYFSYLTGANLKIFLTGFHFPDNPGSMFKKFLSFRMAQHNDANQSLSLIEQVQPYTIIPKDNLSYNERLQQVFSDPDLDISAADDITYRYIFDKYIARAEKMNVLYELALQHQKDHDAFLYLIDILDILKPIEYTPQLITLYHQQASIDIKRNLLFNISRSVSNLMTEGKTVPPEQRNNVVLIKKLFKAILENETDPIILKTAIQSYQNIGGPEHAKDDINAALLRAEQNRITLNFTPEELLLVKIWLALDTKESQLRDLPELLTTSNPVDATLMPFDLAFTLNEIKPEHINDKLRMPLKDYLLKYQTAISNQVAGLKTYHPDLANCNWLSAYATVMTKKEADKIPFMYDYIRALSSPILQAAYLNQLTFEISEKITDNDRRYYQDSFQKKLQDSTLSDDDRALLQEALSGFKETV